MAENSVKLKIYKTLEKKGSKYTVQFLKFSEKLQIFIFWKKGNIKIEISKKTLPFDGEWKYTSLSRYDKEHHAKKIFEI